MARRGIGLPDGAWLAAALAIVSVAEASTASDAALHAPRPVLAVAAGLAAVLLRWRRQAPVAVLAGQGAVLSAPDVAWGAGSQLAAPALSLAVALFSCGRFGRRPLALLSVPLAAVIILAQNALDPDTTVSGSWTWTLNTLWIFGAGAWMRQKEELIDKTRSEAAEHEHAVLAEERLRLARDLHDVLAHNLAVMVVQAEAGVSPNRSSDRSERALELIASTGREALSDLRALLPALRGHEPPTGRVRSHGVESGMRVADLAAVGTRLASAGIEVRFAPDPARLPEFSPAVGECVFRLVQEGLTNAVRHSASAAVDVAIQVDGDAVRVAVEDAGPAADKPTASGPGYGLQGMRERVTALGGTLAFGPVDGGGYHLVAKLPCGDRPRAPQQVVGA